MVVSEAVKAYIANLYCSGTLHLEGVKDFTEDCALDKLRTPLPAGETHATICVAEVLDWAATHLGWSPPGGAPVSTAIKDYIADMYCGGVTHLEGVKDFTEDCALDKLRTPLPAGETHATICVAEVLDWAATHIGYVSTGGGGGGGGYVDPSPPPTGYAQIRCCTVPGGVHPVINNDVNPQVTYACSDLDPKWIGINVPIGGEQQVYKVQFELLPDFERALNTAKKSAAEDYWGPFVDGQIEHIRHAMVASPGAAMGSLKMNAQDAETGVWLGARPNINGIGGEEKYLMLGEEGITMPLPVGTYEVTCTHPGYATPERVSVHLTEEYSVSNPYVIPTFLMKEIKIWKQIEVLERARKAAWIVAFDIESPIVWEVQSEGSITFEFLEEAAYRAYFSLHPLPANWEVGFPIDELPASVMNVFCTIEGDYTKVADGETLQVLNPILHTGRRYKAPFELIIEKGEVPAGWYVAVASVDMWKEVL